ncbi:MAG: FKBP-type peptidyl-prolyl cis-trans isomerase [Flavobacteriales bacterium]|nr:FKBP-type peptidyl-prolyl cis-trans isomerase [Flavobacteriales bacterium]
MFRIFLILLGAIIICSCDSTTPEYYYTKGNLKYKYHDIVEDGKIPAIGDYLTVYIDYRTVDGKIIYSSVQSTYNNKQTIHLGKPSIEGGIEEGFAQLMEGDSVTFYIEANKFFKHYLNQSVPAEIKDDEEVLITLRLLKIESPNEYEVRIGEEEKVCELNEFMEIDSIVNNWKADGDSVFEVGGIYMVKEIPSTLDTIKYGHVVSVFYKGYYSNGKEFYNNLEAEHADDFKVGVEGQTIEGMKIAMLHMNKGQKAKIIVPSYLGFSEQAVNSGQVPSCTPLIFELEIQP